MNRQTIAAALLSCAGLAGCATFVEGTDQTIFVNLSPPTATCAVVRKGEAIASVSDTSNVINITKSRRDIFFECEAPGYQRRVFKVESGASGWGLAGCAFYGACIADYTTGALNKYPGTVSVVLRKL